MIMLPKWLAILLSAWIVATLFGIAVSDYARHGCQAVLGKAGRTPADIQEICR